MQMKSIAIAGKTAEGKAIQITLPSDSNGVDDTKDREYLQRWLVEQQPSELTVINTRLLPALLQQIIDSSFHNNNLRVLSFRSSQFNQDNLQLLIHLLRRNRSIESVDLFHCLQLFPINTTSNSDPKGSISSLINELLQLFADSRYLRSISGCTVTKPILRIAKPLTSTEMDLIYAELRKSHDLKNIISLLLSLYGISPTCHIKQPIIISINFT